MYSSNIYILDFANLSSCELACAILDTERTKICLGQTRSLGVWNMKMHASSNQRLRLSSIKCIICQVPLKKHYPFLPLTKYHVSCPYLLKPNLEQIFATFLGEKFEASIKKYHNISMLSGQTPEAQIIASLHR